MLLSSLEVRLGITGESQVVTALGHVQQAQTKVAAAVGAAPPAGGGMAGLGGLSTIMGMVGGIVALAGAFAVLGAGIGRATAQAVEFGKEILTIQALTGSTIQQAAQISTLFKITGGDSMRDVLELTENLKTAQGMGTLSKYGIKVDVNSNGVETMMKFIDALRHAVDSPKKTQDEIAVFGLRGVASLQGILKMTDAAFTQTKLIASWVDGRGIAAITNMATSWRLLGETVLEGLVVPLVSSLMPALQFVVDKMIGFVNWAHDLSKHKSVVEGIAVAFGLVAGAIAGVSIALGVMALKTWAVASAAAVVDALEGNWGALAAGLAVGVGTAGLGGWIAYNAMHQGSPEKDSIDKLHQTVRDIHAMMIGGGERSNRVKSEIEADYSLRRAVIGGVT